MPFKFKLSKRLALMKASIAVSAGLALACDRADLTSPQSLSPLTEVVASLSPISVVASGDDGNIPPNTLDQNLDTRWSAQGDGQWIRYDVGALAALDHVDIAWYLGDTRSAYFDIQVSLDTVTWTKVFSGQSSGQTLQLERYAFPKTVGRYVRIVGHGNSASRWNSIAEVMVMGTALPALASVGVVASANDGNVPQNTLDNGLATRWSAQGDGQWIQYDLGALAALNGMGIAWFVGDTRIAYFDIAVSLDNVVWTKVFSGQSGGQTLQLESYTFSTASARYIRIVGHGNNMSTWNSIAETAIFGTRITVASVAVASVAVSPTTASVQAGAATQLVAATLDSAGHPLTGRTVIWTTSDEAVATVSTSGLLTGVASGTTTVTATSEGKSGTATVTTAPSCLTSSGIWQNSAVASQTGAFEVQFDATPNAANMNGVAGFSNGPATDWTSLAVIVRFNATGTIDARNGADYAATATIPYTAGTTYHFRLDVDVPSHRYSVSVTPAGAAEQLLASGFAFRSEQATVSALNNLGVYANAGGATACGVALAAWTPPPVASVTVSPVATSVAVGGTLQLTATLKDASGQIMSGSVTWTASSASLATVSSTGL